VAALLLLSVASASGRTRTGAPTLAISGHGFGQGVGLSQWGAEERAVAGQSAVQILGFYYPGTEIGSAAVSAVRVLIVQRPTVTVSSSGAIEAVDAAGRSIVLAAGAHVFGEALEGVDGISYPLTLRPQAAPLRVGGIAYHGELTLSRDGTEVQVVNRVPLEQYVADVVSAECPGSWLPAALESQAIASRSYAIANLRPDQSFDLYANDRSQNYRGMEKEFPRAVAAAAATRSRVLRYDGRVADAFFSAADGGRTNDSVSAWGLDGVRYLVSRPDPFDARSPDTNWGPVRIPLGTLYRSFPRLPMGITSVSLVRNNAGRARLVVFTAADGASMAVDGYRFQQLLGLRSTYLSSAVLEP
jgi:SpoIID/LytB domain protein